MAGDSATEDAVAFEYGTLVTYVAMGVIVLLITLVVPVSTFLVGLKFVQMLDPSREVLQKVQVAPGQGVSKSHAKRMLQSMVSSAKGSRGSLAVGPTNGAWLQRREFMEDFDALGVAVVVLAAMVAVSAALSYGVGVRPGQLPLLMSLIALPFIIHLLVKMEFTHGIISTSDRAAIIVFGVLGGGAAAALLVALPPGWLDFPLPAAGEELQRRLVPLLEARVGATRRRLGVDAGAVLEQSREMAAVCSGVLGVLLPVLGGAIGGLLMAPAMRYGRLLTQALHPPNFSRGFADVGLRVAVTPGERAALSLAYLSTLLLVPLWVTPMTDVLRLPSAWLPLVRIAAVALAAALQLAALRPLVQTWLNTAALNWHILKFSGGPDEEAMLSNQQRHISAVNVQVCKVGLQLLLLPALLAVLAGLMALKCRGAPWAAPGTPDAAPSELLAMFCGFLVWWAALWWNLYAGLSVMLVRMGATSGILSPAR